MLMALPLLPVDKVVEGFLFIRQFYTENVENSLSVESCRMFQRYFQYYKSTWLQGLLNLKNNFNNKELCLSIFNYYN